MLAARQILGERGERIAERYLVEKGWRILDRRFRSGHRDIDLITEKVQAAGDTTIAFVEVKARVSANYGGPLGAVHWRKQRELVKAARDWMGLFHPLNVTYRFDVVGVVFGPGEPQIVHVENAFAVR